LPTYSYLCGRCGHTFELKQGFDAEPEQECPQCHNGARRQFHAVGVIYKGPGFYTTDYRNSRSDSSGRSESVSVEPSSGAEAGKGEDGKQPTSSPVPDSGASDPSPNPA
jgi:putative FmdB family regulatory protein